MTTPHGYRRVDLPIDRSDEVMDVDGWGFSFTPRRKEARALLDVFEYSRGRGIEIADAAHGEVGSLAAVHTSFAHDLRLPGGGSILTSGLTWVAVHPGHRRRGLLTSMLHDHFSRSLERGEVISTLTASEPPIYQRFGYGMASMTCRLQLPRGAALRPVPGADDLTIRLENADVAKHADAVRQVQSRMDRPGTMVTLADPILKDLFIDVPALRGGAERLRIAIVEDADGPAAYALFFRKTDWDNGHPNGATTIKCWGSAHGPATHRLFSVVADLDLMDKTTVTNVAVDDSLMHQLVDVRAAKVDMRDHLWLRILDVPAALQARTYADDADITVQVVDSVLEVNDGVYRFEASDGSATVTKVADGSRGAQADVTVGIQDLSAAYLGGISLAALAGAGLVTEHKAGALNSLSRAMRGTMAAAGNLDF